MAGTNYQVKYLINSGKCLYLHAKINVDLFDIATVSELVLDVEAEDDLFGIDVTDIAEGCRTTRMKFLYFLLSPIIAAPAIGLIAIIGIHLWVGFMMVSGLIFS